MDGRDRLAERFEADRPRLRAVAYRVLGSLSEAEDAVQDAWLRASQADVSGVQNLTAWLTTVVTRVCLNQLRTRRTRGEEPLDELPGGPDAGSLVAEGGDPEQEALMADSVGIALLVVLDTLTPVERVAFVLHDMFAVPFDEIAPIIERSPATTRQLASRARRRVRGNASVSASTATSAPASASEPAWASTTASEPFEGPARRRRIVDAFLTATRAGDFSALVTLLHPDVVLHADRLVIPTPEPVVVHGADTVAHGAMAAMARARFTGPALLDGTFGLVMAPHGRLRLVLTFTIEDGLITEIDVIADPERLDGIHVAPIDG